MVPMTRLDSEHRERHSGKRSEWKGVMPIISDCDTFSRENSSLPLRE
jgi:hypothetical protein